MAICVQPLFSSGCGVTFAFLINGSLTSCANSRGCTFHTKNHAQYGSVASLTRWNLPLQFPFYPSDFFSDRDLSPILASNSCLLGKYRAATFTVLHLQHLRTGCIWLCLSHGLLDLGKQYFNWAFFVGDWGNWVDVLVYLLSTEVN